MGSHCSERSALLPKGWTKRVKSALVHAVSLAAIALNLAYGRACKSRSLPWLKLISALAD